MKIKFIQNIIDSLRGKIFGLESITNKYLCSEKIKDSKTLILGSSQIESSYIPNKEETNIASASMDLYYSYKLYEKYNNKNIKNIILSFSVFTPGSSLVMQNNAFLCVLHKVLNNIDYQYPEIAKKKNLYSLEKRYKKASLKYIAKNTLPQNYRGERMNEILETNYHSKEIIQKRALRHLKHNQRKNHQMEYCEKILKATAKAEQNLYIVIPPCSEIYREPLPSKDILFNKLYEITNQYTHVKIINLYDDNRFNTKDFIDGDHLNSIGSKKFTEIVRNIIQT